MPSVKAKLKNSALTAMRSAGLYTLARNSSGRKQKLLILCYHGLSLRDEHEWAGHLFITAGRFRQRLACLRDVQANVLPLAEATTRLRNGTLPPRSVAITFDDGFYDFLLHGVPILKEFGFPCTLYLTTYYCGLPFPIINLILSYLLWKSGRTEMDFPQQGMAEPMPLRNWDERLAVTQRLLQWLDAQGRSTQQKEEFARELASRLGIDYDDVLRSRIAQIMTPDEAVQVAKSGVDIQLHTHRHRTPRDRNLFIREINDNRERIRAITGRDAVHFCYPSGVHADEFLPWLKECGVETGTTCERGFARQTSDPLLLPRVLDDSNMDLIQFEAFVSGLLA